VSSAVYLLDTSAEPGPVAQRSRILAKPAGLPPASKVSDGVITPDGRTVHFIASAAGATEPSRQLWSANVSSGRAKVISGFLPTASITPDPSVRRAIGVVEPETNKFRVAMVDLRTGKATRQVQTFWISGSYAW
jgi:hypothetical protein